MELPPVRTGITTAALTAQSDSVQTENARDAFTASRKLNSLDIANREFSVVRDPESQRFKVVVLDEETGAVLDQFPPEDILKMLAQLSPLEKALQGNSE